MAKYEEPNAGQWVQPIKRGYKLACCDCGLVHTMDFRIKRGFAQFRVFRNNRSTAQIRRWMKTPESGRDLKGRDPVGTQPRAQMRSK
jgi:hypothetical protein